MIAPFTLGRTPPPPGPQATAERHAALTPLLERVFPRHQCRATCTGCDGAGGRLR